VHFFRDDFNMLGNNPVRPFWLQSEVALADPQGGSRLDAVHPDTGSLFHGVFHGDPSVDNSSDWLI
jgi:hypothetical protein